ncbi:MAG: acetyl/propionyl/methylcrotonyl-CoA carboxylase subunit alpha [Nevskia sp.]|nr:acetyl/propionyl/methylcrotonyl-CoA carboxylase subunit alpha [Nevskia sp.]
MFTKILIANRGEIACRVIKTCRALGVSTVAVYSEADANSRHVRLADAAYLIGRAASTESYLNIDRVIAAAKQSGAQAIHPGYGFLSENVAFAEACQQAEITFIGPPIEAIRAMASKSAAKQLMAQASVPLVPGYHGDHQSPDFLRQYADDMGYPVLIKATAGGGGKGMRVVTSHDEFHAALASCQREAKASFGDDRVLLEKYLLTPRHIEIQVFGDAYGNVVSLHERDCSAQRRHQKVVEEAPAPNMTAEQRAAMGKAACDAARAVAYVGAGTVEFITNEPGAFYFMEMNTRLQVEHPVTELVTGLDLVEWQLRIAAGEPLPLTQAQIPLAGHAIEARIYAEDPEKGFLPSIGHLSHFKLPPASPVVRIDAGVEQGDDISPYYDPMLAKLIVWGETRERAVTQMLAALGEFQIAGVGNNIDFLSRLIDHPMFRAGRVDTGLIERERHVLVSPSATAVADAAATAGLWSVLEETRQARVAAHAGVEHDSPWSGTDGWRISGTYARALVVARGEEQFSLTIAYRHGGLALNDQTVDVHTFTGVDLRYSVGGQRHHADVVRLERQIHVFQQGCHFEFSLRDPLTVLGDEQSEQGGLNAPMPGKIIAHLVAIGDSVEPGAALLVMEAMKMEHTLCAPAAGTVRAFLCAVGDQVGEGTELVDFATEAPA